MATTIDELIVQIRADTRQLNTQLTQVRRRIDDTFPSGQRSPIAGFATQLRGLVGPLLAVGGAMGAISAVQGIARIGDEFEALGITLGRIYGSQAAGEKAFEDIRVFAETTPFQLEDVTKAFIALKSNGIEPSTDMLTIFGDAASAAMNPIEAFNALIRITQRAAGGGLGLEELEQLVNQGIPVYTILQREIGKSRTELSELGKTAEGASIIMDALQTGLQKDFGGIMADRMELLSTKTSNMEIAFKNLQDTLYQSGLGEFFKGLADDMASFLNKVTEGIQAAQEAEALRKGVPQSVLTAARMADTAERGVGGHRGRIARNYGTTVSEAIDAETTRILDEIERLRSMAEPKGKGGHAGRQARQEYQNRDARIAELQATLEAMEAFLASREPLEIKTTVTAPETTTGTTGTGEGTKPDPSALIVQQEALGRLQKVLEKTVTDTEELNAQFADLALIEAAGGLGLSADQIERIRTYLNGIKDDMAIDELKDKFGELQSLVEGTTTPFEELQAEIAKLQAILDSGDAKIISFLFGTTNPEATAEVMRRLREELGELKNKTSEVAETFDTTMAQAITNLSHSFTNDFVNALMTGQNALDAFKNFAKNLVSQIIATFLQMAVVNQILNAIFGAGGMNVNGWKPLPTISFGAPKASGGAMMSGTPYLVGERGPELFIPHTAGTLRNGNDTRSMAGNGAPIVINQSLNFSTGVVPTVRAEIQRMLPQISDMTKASVLEATRRGGSYRKGLLGA